MADIPQAALFIIQQDCWRWTHKGGRGADSHEAKSDFCLAFIFFPVFDQRSILVIAQDASYSEKLANAPRNGQRDYSVKKFVLLNPPY